MKKSYILTLFIIISLFISGCLTHKEKADLLTSLDYKIIWRSNRICTFDDTELFLALNKLNEEFYMLKFDGTGVIVKIEKIDFN